MDIAENKEARHEHVDEKGAGADFNNAKFLNEEAAQATAAEHSLTLWQALKTYKRAAFWSVRKSSPTCTSGPVGRLLTLLSTCSHLDHDYHGRL